MTKLNKQRVKDALHATKGKAYLAAKNLGVSHTAIYKYINNYDDVKEIQTYYDEEENDIAELKKREALMSGEQWAIKYQLSTKGKSRGYTERHELTGAEGNELKIIVEYADSKNHAS